MLTVTELHSLCNLLAMRYFINETNLFYQWLCDMSRDQKFHFKWASFNNVAIHLAIDSDKLKSFEMWTKFTELFKIKIPISLEFMIQMLFVAECEFSNLRCKFLGHLTVRRMDYGNNAYTMKQFYVTESFNIRIEWWNQ